jgi:hypothetical protein
MSAVARESSWSRFVDVHQDIFPKLLPRDIGRASFIAFDTSWKAHPVRSYLPSPWELISTAPKYYGLDAILRARR